MRAAAAALCLLMAQAVVSTPLSGYDDYSFGFRSEREQYKQQREAGTGEKSTRVISGTAVANVKWAVAIRNVNEVTVFCGGSIISTDWVITSAVCVRDAPQPVEVLLNTGDLSSSDVMILQSPQVYIHPLFEHSSIHVPYVEGSYYATRNRPVLRYNVALVQVPTLTFSDTLGQVCLPAADAGDFVGTTANMAGWGSTGAYYGGQGSQLYQAAFTVLSNDACKVALNADRRRHWDEFVQDEYLCAFDPAGEASGCSGDWGSGLTTADDVLIGVLSGAFQCADPAAPFYPDGYTRVTEVLDFIGTYIFSGHLC